MNKPNTSVCLSCPRIENPPAKQRERVQLPASPSLPDSLYFSYSEEKYVYCQSILEFSTLGYTGLREDCVVILNPYVFSNTVK